MRRYPFDPARARDLRQSHAATATRSRHPLRSRLRAWMSVLNPEEIVGLFVVAMVVLVLATGSDR